MGWANLEATRGVDIEAFEALPVWHAALFFVGYLLVLSLPVVLALLGAEYTIGAFTLPVLVYSVGLARTQVGRGAMWYFGKGWSPGAQIVGQAIATVIIFIAFLCFRLGVFERGG